MGPFAARRRLAQLVLSWGLALAAVSALSQETPEGDVSRARRLIAAQEYDSAAQLLGQTLARDPQSLSALVLLVEAFLGMEDAPAAVLAARRAAAADERCVRCQTLLGDALVAQGDAEGAQEAYRQSLSLRPDPLVSLKLAHASRLPAAARLRIRFDGAMNEPLGGAVLEAARVAYAEFEALLGFKPQGTVTIILQTGTEFYDGRVPGWAAAWNDGSIRLPVLGLSELTPALTRALRHELAHSFVSAHTSDNCPTWLHEGIAQWLEGGHPGRADARLALQAREGRLIPLISLEGPFEAMPEARASLAYAESLSVLAHIRREWGDGGLRELLDALGNRLPAEDALPSTLGSTYAQLQRSWEAFLSQADGYGR